MEAVLFPLGDRAVTVRWGEGIDEEAHNRVLDLFEYLSHTPVPGVLDLIPAYNSLTIVYDPVEIRMGAPDARAWIQTRIESLLRARSGPAADRDRVREPATFRTVEVPVCYDAEFCIGSLPLPTAEIASIHSAMTYKVYMLGFLPGFAYMGTVDARITFPRKAQPAPLVPAGSVGIAGLQTGIYPLDSPGGWNIIGRTPLRLFDADSPDPVFFRPGDRVRFLPITQEAYYAYRSS